jgi:phenylalanyl-tRNA synthetase alpha chain
MNLEDLQRQAQEDISRVQSTEELQQVKAKYLGKKGLITLAIKDIANIPPEQRREYGLRLNQIKEFVENLLEEAQERLKNLELERELAVAWEELTVSLPKWVGALHPISQTLERIESIFLSMGFSVEEGPEVELESYNFDLLNIPKDHPARDMQDTFYVNKEGYLLRTHTSPVQIRVMLSQKPPIYMDRTGQGL